MSGAVIAAVGDVLIDRADPAGALAGVADLLSAADLVFGNFEGVLTDVHAPTPGMSSATVVPTANASPLGLFDVMSVANNHAMDAGYGGLTDTLSTLRAQGIHPIGAGSSLSDALRPYHLQLGDTRIAILAVTAVLTAGTEARATTPGVATLRAEDSYAPPFPGLVYPGVPAKVMSILSEEDWTAVQAAVAEAKANADFVVVSAHWGDHTRPWVLTEHERLCAELLADEGVDLILGHHQHLLRGVEFLGDTTVFYGLGHLAFDMPRFPDEMRARGVDVDGLSDEQLADSYGDYGVYPRAASPGFFFHPRARHSTIAIVELDGNGIGRSGLVPCRLGDDGVAQVVHRKDENWDDMMNFLFSCLRKPRLNTELVDEGLEFHGAPLLTFRPGTT
jgi:hypothetical protein